MTELMTKLPASLDDRTSAGLRKTRSELLQAHHLPGYFYTSPEIFELEIERIFMKEWLCVGRVEEFENPGDYSAMRIVGEPILMCRDNDGNLNAFSNVCRHRGVEVASGEGNAKRFSCPYHGWVYDLDGQLRGAPHTREVEGFDVGEVCLPRVNIDTWGGYVFVNLDPDCQSLADHLDEDDVRKFAAFLKPEETRTCDKYVLEVPCNWKFVPENLMDMYHVGVIHKTSFGGHFPLEDFRFNLTKYGYNATYESLTLAPKGVTLFGAMPWLEGKVGELFGCTTWIRPAMNIFGRHDMIQPWTALPLDVNRTQVTVYTQLPKTFFDTPGFEEKNQIYIDFIRLVANEDMAMLESLQNGVKSRNYQPGRTVKLERAIHHLLNYYVDRLLGEDEEARRLRLDQGDEALRDAHARNGPPTDAGFSAAFRTAE